MPPAETSTATSSDTPLISVLMTVYNREGLLAESVESILNQSYPNWELIIIDDASTDRTRSIIEGYLEREPRVRALFLEHNIGPYPALNRALEVARGDYVAINDSDDLSHPDRLRETLHFLQSHPEMAMVGSSVYLIDESGKRFARRNYPQSADAVRRSILHSCPFLHSSTLMRTEVLKELGGYDESFRNSADVDLWIRLTRRYQACNLPFPYASYRVSLQQETSRMKYVIRMVLKIRRRYLFEPGYRSFTSFASYLGKSLILILPEPLIKKIHRIFYYRRS